MTHPELNLGGHSGVLYDKGRNRGWQVLWFVTSKLIFEKWWLPASVRPRILRAFGANVGEGVYIRNDVRIHWPWKISLGSNVWVGEDAWLLNLAPVDIGANTCISQAVMLIAGSHRRQDPHFEHANAPIVIGERVWLCARSTVLAGSQIGSGVVVGAGLTVRGQIKPDSVLRLGTPS